MTLSDQVPFCTLPRLVQSFPPDARASLMGSSAAPALSGEVLFWQTDLGVVCQVCFAGLPRPSRGCGFFALHIHNGTACTGEPAFADALGHYNPGDLPHPCHAGDLPPVLAVGQWAYSVFLTDRFHLQEVLGKAVILHAGADDFTSQPAGNAGERLACGLIEKAAP
ncbi:MAG: superoxide dismutase family protein [Oscillospiraceae bacterium]|nr:superoxide dismutase family protein [Oscillospiraceae bacterium]